MLFSSHEIPYSNNVNKKNLFYFKVRVNTILKRRGPRTKCPACMEPTKPGPATLVQYNTVYNNCREEEAEPAVEDKPDVNFVQPLSTTVVTHLKFNHIYVRMMGGGGQIGRNPIRCSIVKRKDAPSWSLTF